MRGILSSSFFGLARYCYCLISPLVLPDMTPEENKLDSLIEDLASASNNLTLAKEGLPQEPSLREENGFITQKTLAQYKEDKAEYAAKNGSLEPLQKALRAAVNAFEAAFPDLALAKLNNGTPMLLPVTSSVLGSGPLIAIRKSEKGEYHLQVVANEQEARKAFKLDSY